MALLGVRRFQEHHGFDARRRRRGDDPAPQGGDQGDGHHHTDRILTRLRRSGPTATASAARAAPSGSCLGSERSRVSLGGFAQRPALGALERLDCARLVDVDERVVLLGDARGEPVALALGLRPVDDTDRTLGRARAAGGRRRPRRAGTAGTLGSAWRAATLRSYFQGLGARACARPARPTRKRR